MMCDWHSAKQKKREWGRDEEVIGEHRRQPRTKINTVSQLLIFLTCNLQNYMIKANLMDHCMP
jgi:hypothetical protein